ncbi:hypothetical protein Bbelb_335520 [Branchiostoma belcheri]|nr:hypothetical protein Bbelb_335520 [Branchiostoma belcheri]
MSAQLTRYLPELKSHGLLLFAPFNGRLNRNALHCGKTIGRQPPTTVDTEDPIVPVVTDGPNRPTANCVRLVVQHSELDTSSGLAAGKIPTSPRTSGLPDNDDPGEHSVNAQAEIGRHVIGMFGLLAKFGRMDKG